MPADQTAAELTTRDVLLQVDRRLTLIEEDLRSLDEKLDDKIDGLRIETNLRFERVNTRIDEVCTKLDAKIDTKFYWTLGTILVSWISTIVAVLFK